MRRIQTMTKTLCRAIAVVAVGCALTGSTSAQTFTHTIRLIVPFPAGGSNDVMARIIAPHLEQALGQTVIVDNRPAAAGIVGSDAVAKAPPDGHTLLLVASSHTVTPAVNSKLPYNTEKDFAPLSLINTNAMVFFDNPNVPAKTLKEFIALAKKNPGKFNYSSPGAGSQTHLTVELLSKRAGIKMQHIPYQGGAPAMTAVISGEVQFTMLAPNVIFPHIEAGTIRPIATGDLTRHPRLPDVPTLTEEGFPDIRAIQWVGMFTTAGTPKPMLDRLNTELNRIVRLPDVIEKLKQQGVTATGSTQEEFAKLIATEIKNWTEVAHEANIKIE